MSCSTPFEDATWEQLARILEILDRLDSPALNAFARWAEGEDDAVGSYFGLEFTISSWEMKKIHILPSHYSAPSKWKVPAGFTM